MVRKNVPADVFRYIDTKGNDPTQCWPWFGSTGGRDDRGYINIDGKKRQAHIVVNEMFFGPIPKGIIVRHTCDFPRCCNPYHHIRGTRSQNEDDKYDRDRAGYTHDMIREMRRLRKLGMDLASIMLEINTKYNVQVSTSGIGKVLRGVRRKSHGQLPETKDTDNE